MMSLYPKCPLHTGPVANAARHLGKGEKGIEGGGGGGGQQKEKPFHGRV